MLSSPGLDKWRSSQPVSLFRIGGLYPKMKSLYMVARYGGE
jgi:hypothetical protein